MLAVDDDRDSLELLRELLAQCGAEIVVASTAEEALSKLVELRPHVVIADVAMPGVDGYAFMGSVRTLPADAGGSTPALALTALAGADDSLKALRAGFQMHIAKPVDTVTLPRVVRELALQGPASGPS